MSKKDTAYSVATLKEQLPASASSDEIFGQFEGQGFEHVGASDLIIPRLTVLQALSPQVQPKKAEYIKDAKVGDICDVGTGEIFEAPLLFLPVFYAKQWLEWAPRDSGGGLVKVHSDNKILEATKPDQNNRPVLDNGNYVAETAQFFGLNLSAAGRRSFLPLASTQLKRARRWLSLATSEKVTRKDGTTFTPPLYYRTYNLSTLDEGNKKGDWVGWKIERGPSLPEMGGNWQDLLKDAQAFRESIKKGEVRGELAEDVEPTADAEGAM